MHGKYSSWLFKLPLFNNLLDSSTASSIQSQISNILLFYTFQYKLTHIQCGPWRFWHKPNSCLGSRPPLFASQYNYMALSGSCFGLHIHNIQVTWIHWWPIQEGKLYLLRNFVKVHLQWWYTSSWMLNCLVVCSWVALSYPNYLLFPWWQPYIAWLYWNEWRAV